MNKINVAVAALLAVALGTSASFGEVNYWGKIESAIIAGGESREAAKAADVYLRSLTQEQLILAGRQCSSAMAKKFPPFEWDQAGANLGFFYQYYPMTDGALDNLEPLLRELHDKDGSAFWRRFLVFMLTSGLNDKLTHKQAVQVMTHLADVLQDSSDSIHVRNKIPLPLARFIGAEHGRVMAAKLQDEKFSKLIREKSGDYMRLFAEPTTPVSLKKSLLAGLMALFRAGVPTSEAINGFVQELFYHYEGVDCLLWLQLANYGTNELKLPRAQEVVAEMLKDIPGRIQDAQRVRGGLQRIVTRHIGQKAGG